MEEEITQYTCPSCGSTLIDTMTPYGGLVCVTCGKHFEIE